MEKSSKFLRENLEFRAKWQSHKQSIHDPDVAEYLKHGVWRLCGTTRFGHVIELIKVGNFHPKDVTSDEVFTRTLIAESEYMSQMIHDAKAVHPTTGRIIEDVVVIFDMAGWSLFDQGTPRGLSLTKTLIDVTQNCYPEGLEKCILFNAPWVFRTAWKILQPLLDEHTASRVQFVTDPNVLHEFIDPSTLHTQYGGTRAEEWPIPAV